jgi:hypothetical protein
VRTHLIDKYSDTFACEFARMDHEKDYVILVLLRYEQHAKY